MLVVVSSVLDSAHLTYWELAVVVVEAFFQLQRLAVVVVAVVVHEQQLELA